MFILSYNRLKVIFFCLALLFAFVCKAERYWLAYPEIQDKSNSRLVIYILNPSVQPLDYKVKVGFRQIASGTVKAFNRSSKIITIPYSLVKEQGKSQAIQVETSHDFAQIYVFVHSNNTKSFMQLLGEKDLGLDYTIISHHVQPDAGNQWTTFFQVVSLATQTTLSILPSQDDVTGKYKQGQPFTINLDYLEVFTFQSLGDVSLSQVSVIRDTGSACFPVAIFAGSPSMPIGLENLQNVQTSTSDHLFVQLPPKGYFARNYIVPKTDFFAGTQPDYVKIISLYDQNLVWVGTDIQSHPLAKNESLWVAIDKPVLVRSEKPIMIAQYIPGTYKSASNQASMLNGNLVHSADSDMIILPPIDQYSNKSYLLTDVLSLIENTTIDSQLSLFTLTFVFDNQQGEKLLSRYGLNATIHKIPQSTYSILTIPLNQFKSIRPYMTLIDEKPLLYFLAAAGADGLFAESIFISSSGRNINLKNRVFIKNENLPTLFPDQLSEQTESLYACKGEKSEIYLTLPYPINRLVWNINGVSHAQIPSLVQQTEPYNQGKQFIYKADVTLSNPKLQQQVIAVETMRGTDPDFPIQANSCRFNEVFSLTVQVFTPSLFDFQLNEIYCKNQEISLNPTFISSINNAYITFPILYWATDDIGNEFRDINNNISYSLLGHRVITVTQIDTHYCAKMLSKSIEIIDNPSPQFMLTSSLCAFNNIEVADTTLSNLPLGSILTRVWQQSNLIQTNTMSLSPKTSLYLGPPGIYQISLKVNYSGGCSSKMTTTILSLSSSPMADYDIPVGICSQDTSIMFTNTTDFFSLSQENVQYQWFLDGAVVPSAKQRDFITLNLSTGIHSLSLFVFSDNGCTSTITKDIQVNDSDIRIDFEIVNGNLFCSNETVVLINRSSILGQGGFFGKIVWSLDLLNDQNNTIVLENDAIYDQENRIKDVIFRYPLTPFSLTKEYRLKLKVFAGLTCFAEKQTDIIVKGVPSIVYSAISTLCSNDEQINLNIDSNYFFEKEGIDGIFEFQGGAVSNIGILDPGLADNQILNFLVTFTAENFCADTRYIKVPIVLVNPVDVLDYYLVLKNQSLEIDYTLPQFVIDYHWNESDGIIFQSDKKIIFDAQKSESLTLELFFDNNCSLSQTIFIDVQETFNLSNFYTPNQDSFNDDWDLDFVLESFPNSSITIFNRLGTVVFNNYVKNFKDYFNIDSSFPQGVYFYILQNSDAKGVRQLSSGSISILK